MFWVSHEHTIIIQYYNTGYHLLTWKPNMVAIRLLKSYFSGYFEKQKQRIVIAKNTGVSKDYFDVSLIIKLT